MPLSQFGFAPRFALFAAALGIVLSASRARAEDLAAAPPPDIEKVAKGPDTAPEAPKVEEKPDGIAVSVSAGALSSTGNSRMVASTGSGNVEARVGPHGLGASLIGNYGRSAAPGDPLETTAENLQGRLRYDYYVVDRLSLFALVTGRHDRLQGVAFRLNLDPGVKYLFVNLKSTALWGELGYDFQYDVRTDEARVVTDDAGNPTGLVDKTATDHSVRAYLGFRHDFNDNVTLANGIEYLQSVVDSSRYRANYDILFTAQVVGGFALGVGFNARFDNMPLPDKQKLDTATTLNLVYSYSSAKSEG
jgi:putative salt-induced outer membrane protein YdiY